MFTGIVEELGTVKKIKKGANSAVFTIRAEKILDDLKTGVWTQPTAMKRIH